MVVQQEDLEQKCSLRLNTLRNCKIEGINIPLIRGSLSDIPIGEDAILDDMMDLDEDAGPTQVGRVTDDHGIDINFTSLSKDLQKVRQFD